MYRPRDWNNYYTQSDKTDGMMRAEAFEEGADAMLIHIIELTKKLAPYSKLLEVLSELRKSKWEDSLHLGFQ